MLKSQKVNQETRVITGPVRLSYVQVWEPKAMDGGKPKFSVTPLIPKTDRATLDAMDKAIKAAARQGQQKFGEDFMRGLRIPLRDGDTDESKGGAEGYVGCMFLNASTYNRPGVLDRNKQPLEDKEELYSGCYARASLNFYPYKVNGNKGVACGLNNLMKVRDGEYLGGRARAEADFADVEVEDDFDDDL